MEHWKKAINPDYLGAYSLDNGEGGYNQIDGLITHVLPKEVMNESGKKQKLIAYTNIGKPFILNATNTKLLVKLARSNYYEKWKNIPVTFYVEVGCRDPKGGKTDGLRIKQQVQRAKIDYTAQTNTLRSCTTLEGVKVAYLALTKAEQVALVGVKDEMKNKLSK